MENQRIVPFLTFNSNAEEAMEFYAANLPGAKITKMVRYGENHPSGGSNLIMFGSISFMGQQIMFLDMDPAHPCPPFSWSTSIYIQCQDESEFDIIFERLSDGGQVMMGPEAVAHIRKCAWVTDKFGITWQPVWE